MNEQNKLNDETLSGLSTSNAMIDILLDTVGSLKVSVKDAPHVHSAFRWLEALKENIQSEIQAKIPKPIVEEE